MILNAVVSCSTTNSALIFLLFRDLNLKLVIYDVVPLYWPRKPLISQDNTNAIIFQANKRKKHIFKVVLKERLVFAHPQFVLNLRILSRSLFIILHLICFNNINFCGYLLQFNYSEHQQFTIVRVYKKQPQNR